MDEPTHSNATENKEDDCQKAERKMSMKNRMKQLSALVLAATMAMGTYTSAFAADMTVYIRDNSKEISTSAQSDDTTATPNIPVIFTIHNVDSRMSLYTALTQAPTTAGMLDTGVTLTTAWNPYTDTTTGNTYQYLLSLSATDKTGEKTKSFAGTNDGKNTRLDYDKEGNLLGGKYEGNSWMWGWTDGSNLNSTSYPDVTLNNAKCKDVDFAIILSFDYSSFEWAN